jgi:hypothetical protein
MKIKTITIILWCIFIISAILYKFEITGSFVSFLCSGSVLSIIYLFFSKKIIEPQDSFDKHWLLSISGIIWCLSFIAIIYNISKFPGFDIISIIILILLITLIIFSLVVRNIKNKESCKIYKKIIIQSVIFHFLIAISFPF